MWRRKWLIYEILLLVQYSGQDYAHPYPQDSEDLAAVVLTPRKENAFI